MKKRTLFLIVAVILFVDQALKIYIKTKYHLGESHDITNWFKLYFVENPGMAYGWKFGGDWGKMALTIFRLGAVGVGTWYILKILKEKRHWGFLLAVAMVYAGAIGNLIDSCFYGLIFDKGMIYDPVMNDYMGYSGLAVFSNNGYASFLHGNVVDMLYFPLIRGHFPTWFPIWGGEDFEFFRPIFNIADASITSGILIIFLFQKTFLNNFTKTETVVIEKENINSSNIL